jgi:hypothetical protein
MMPTGQRRSSTCCFEKVDAARYRACIDKKCAALIC